MRVGPKVLAAAGVGIGVFVWTFSDYRAWRALGPGGLPSTWRGWLETKRLRLLKRGALALGGLHALQGTSDDLVTLADLPSRNGERPRVGPHPVPHRQLSDHAPANLRALLAERFAARAAGEPDRLELVRSHFEKHNMAVTVHADVRHHDVACAAYGEAGHVHPSDGSMHMILSPSDACVAVERGWGELHGLAGRAFGLPLTYTLIYAPRNEYEAATVMRILDAAIAYMTHRPASPVA